MSESIPGKLDSLLSKAQGDGVLTESGLAFTLDQKKALQKVLQFSANSLADWALLVLQSATLSGAQVIDFTWVDNQFRVTWSPEVRLDLERFSADALRPEQHLDGSQDPLRRACWAVMRHGELRVQSQGSLWLWRDGQVQIETQEQSGEGLSFVFRPEDAPISHPTNVRNLIEERGTLGPLKVRWDGPQISSKPKDGSLKNSPVWLATAHLSILESPLQDWLEGQGSVKERLHKNLPLLSNGEAQNPGSRARLDYWCSLACEEIQTTSSSEYVTQIPPMVASVLFTKHGVVVADLDLGSAPIGCRLVLAADDLRTDLSGLKASPENFDSHSTRQLLESSWPVLRAALLPLCSRLSQADSHFLSVDLQSVGKMVTLKQRLRQGAGWGVIGLVSALAFQAPAEAAIMIGLVFSAISAADTSSPSSYGRMSRLVKERIESTETLKVT